MKPFLCLSAFCLIASAQEFDVASVKPNPAGQGAHTRMISSAFLTRYIGVPLRWLVAFAYDVPFTQVLGPDWISREAYDIDARSSYATTPGERCAMLQSLLVERFHLKAHRETREVQSLVMTVAKSGVKMRSTTEPAAGYRLTNDGSFRKMQVNATPKAFAAIIAGLVHEPMIDQTGLTDVYAIEFTWDVSVPAESADNLLRAIEGHLGLRIERKRIPLEVVIVDQAEKVPTEN